MAPLVRVLPLAALVVVAACDGTAGSGDDPAGGTLQREAVIARDARVVWSAEIDPGSEVDGAVVAGKWVLVSTTEKGTTVASVIGFDRSGVQWWQRATGHGSARLTVLDDGLVRECGGSNHGDVLDPATGDVVRTGAECPAPQPDDVYDVDGSELVVYTDVEHSSERFRIALRDDDAVAFAVDRGVVTYSADSNQVRSYR